MERRRAPKILALLLTLWEVGTAWPNLYNMIDLRKI